MIRCHLPAAGWICNLEAGHDGPCPAWPAEDNPGPMTQNRRGEWVPSIPEPFWVGWGLRTARCCDCGRHFKNGQRYREHYAYAHILGLRD